MGRTKGTSIQSGMLVFFFHGATWFDRLTMWFDKFTMKSMAKLVPTPCSLFTGAVADGYAEWPELRGLVL